MENDDKAILHTVFILTYNAKNRNYKSLLKRRKVTSYSLHKNYMRVENEELFKKRQVKGNAKYTSHILQQTYIKSKIPPVVIENVKLHCFKNEEHKEYVVFLTQDNESTNTNNTAYLYLRRKNKKILIDNGFIKTLFHTPKNYKKIIGVDKIWENTVRNEIYNCLESLDGHVAANAVFTTYNPEKPNTYLSKNIHSKQDANKFVENLTLHEKSSDFNLENFNVKDICAIVVINRFGQQLYLEFSDDMKKEFPKKDLPTIECNGKQYINVEHLNRKLKYLNIHYDPKENCAKLKSNFNIKNTSTELDIFPKKEFSSHYNMVLQLQSENNHCDPMYNNSSISNLNCMKNIMSKFTDTFKNIYSFLTKPKSSIVLNDLMNEMIDLSKGQPIANVRNDNFVYIVTHIDTPLNNVKNGKRQNITPNTQPKTSCNSLGAINKPKTQLTPCRKKFIKKADIIKKQESENFGLERFSKKYGQIPFQFDDQGIIEKDSVPELHEQYLSNSDRRRLKNSPKPQGSIKKPEDLRNVTITNQRPAENIPNPIKTYNKEYLEKLSQQIQNIQNIELNKKKPTSPINSPRCNSPNPDILSTRSHSDRDLLLNELKSNFKNLTEVMALENSENTSPEPSVKSDTSFTMLGKKQQMNIIMDLINKLKNLSGFVSQYTTDNLEQPVAKEIMDQMLPSTDNCLLEETPLDDQIQNYELYDISEDVNYDFEDVEVPVHKSSSHEIRPCPLKFNEDIIQKIINTNSIASLREIINEIKFEDSETAKINQLEDENKTDQQDTTCEDLPIDTSTILNESDEEDWTLDENDKQYIASLLSENEEREIIVEPVEEEEDTNITPLKKGDLKTYFCEKFLRNKSSSVININEDSFQDEGTYFEESQSSSDENGEEKIKLTPLQKAEKFLHAIRKSKMENKESNSLDTSKITLSNDSSSVNKNDSQQLSALEKADKFLSSYKHNDLLEQYGSPTDIILAAEQKNKQKLTSPLEEERKKEEKAQIEKDIKHGLEAIINNMKNYVQNSTGNTVQDKLSSTLDKIKMKISAVSSEKIVIEQHKSSNEVINEEITKLELKEHENFNETKNENTSKNDKSFIENKEQNLKPEKQDPKTEENSSGDTKNQEFLSKQPENEEKILKVSNEKKETSLGQTSDKEMLKQIENLEIKKEEKQEIVSEINKNDLDDAKTEIYSIAEQEDNEDSKIITTIINNEQKNDFLDKSNIKGKTTTVDLQNLTEQCSEIFIGAINPCEEQNLEKSIKEENLIIECNETKEESPEAINTKINNVEKQKETEETNIEIKETIENISIVEKNDQKKISIVVDDVIEKKEEQQTFLETNKGENITEVENEDTSESLDTIIENKANKEENLEQINSETTSDNQTICTDKSSVIKLEENIDVFNVESSVKYPSISSDVVINEDTKKSEIKYEVMTTSENDDKENLLQTNGQMGIENLSQKENNLLVDEQESKQSSQTIDTDVKEQVISCSEKKDQVLTTDEEDSSVLSCINSITESSCSNKSSTSVLQNEVSWNSSITQDTPNTSASGEKIVYVEKLENIETQNIENIENIEKEVSITETSLQNIYNEVEKWEQTLLLKDEYQQRNVISYRNITLPSIEEENSEINTENQVSNKLKYILEPKPKPSKESAKQLKLNTKKLKKRHKYLISLLDEDFRKLNKLSLKKSKNLNCSTSESSQDMDKSDDQTVFSKDLHCLLFKMKETKVKKQKLKHILQTGDTKGKEKKKNKKNKQPESTISETVSEREEISEVTGCTSCTADECKSNIFEESDYRLQTTDNEKEKTETLKSKETVNKVLDKHVINVEKHITELQDLLQVMQDNKQYHLAHQTQDLLKKLHCLVVQSQTQLAKIQTHEDQEENICSVEKLTKSYDLLNKMEEKLTENFKNIKKLLTDKTQPEKPQVIENFRYCPIRFNSHFSDTSDCSTSASYSDGLAGEEQVTTTSSECLTESTNTDVEKAEIKKIESEKKIVKEPDNKTEENVQCSAVCTGTESQPKENEESIGQEEDIEVKEVAVNVTEVTLEEDIKEDTGDKIQTNAEQKELSDLNAKENEPLKENCPPEAKAEVRCDPKANTEEKCPKANIEEKCCPKSNTEEKCCPKANGEEKCCPKTNAEEKCCPKTNAREKCCCPKANTEEKCCPKAKTEEKCCKTNTEAKCVPKTNTEEKGYHKVNAKQSVQNKKKKETNIRSSGSETDTYGSEDCVNIKSKIEDSLKKLDNMLQFIYSHKQNSEPSISKNSNSCKSSKTNSCLSQKSMKTDEQEDVADMKTEILDKLKDFSGILDGLKDEKIKKVTAETEQNSAKLDIIPEEKSEDTKKNKKSKAVKRPKSDVFIPKDDRLSILHRINKTIHRVTSRLSHSSEVIEKVTDLKLNLMRVIEENDDKHSRWTKNEKKFAESKFRNPFTNKFRLTKCEIRRNLNNSLLLIRDLNDVVMKAKTDPGEAMTKLEEIEEAMKKQQEAMKQFADYGPVPISKKRKNFVFQNSTKWSSNNNNNNNKKQSEKPFEEGAKLTNNNKSPVRKSKEPTTKQNVEAAPKKEKPSVQTKSIPSTKFPEKQKSTKNTKSASNLAKTGEKPANAKLRMSKSSKNMKKNNKLKTAVKRLTIIKKQKENNIIPQITTINELTFGSLIDNDLIAKYNRIYLKNKKSSDTTVTNSSPNFPSTPPKSPKPVTPSKLLSVTPPKPLTPPKPPTPPTPARSTPSTPSPTTSCYKYVNRLLSADPSRMTQFSKQTVEPFHSEYPRKDNLKQKEVENTYLFKLVNNLFSEGSIKPLLKCSSPHLKKDRTVKQKLYRAEVKPECLPDVRIPKVTQTPSFPSWDTWKNIAKEISPVNKSDNVKFCPSNEKKSQWRDMGPSMSDFVTASSKQSIAKSLEKIVTQHKEKPKPKPVAVHYVISRTSTVKTVKSVKNNLPGKTIKEKYEAWKALCAKSLLKKPSSKAKSNRSQVSMAKPKTPKVISDAPAIYFRPKVQQIKPMANNNFEYGILEPSRTKTEKFQQNRTKMKKSPEHVPKKKGRNKSTRNWN